MNLNYERLLRTDFRFRYDYAQYAISQPISFDWNNRYVRFNRFNRSTNFWNSNTGNYMVTAMHLGIEIRMWNDWLWGMDSGGGIGWSYSWNNNSLVQAIVGIILMVGIIIMGGGWGYGWNNYQNSWYGRRGRSNVSYINGRRGSTMSVQDRIGQASMIESTKRIKRVVKPIRTEKTVVIPNNIIKPIRTIRLNNNPPRSTRPTRVVSTRSNNITPIKSNSKRKN